MSLSDLPYSHFPPYHHHHSPSHHYHHPNYHYQNHNYNHDHRYLDCGLYTTAFFPVSAALSYDLSASPSQSQSTHSLGSNPAFTMNNTLSTDEMERFQQLSNEFEADVQVSLLSDITRWVVNADGQGPLVSTKQSTQAIATEYANADPAFATKSNGDGNCGWRAVAFGYFENLFALRDVVLVQNELVRIKSLSSLLDQVGHQEYLYEIFVDATEQVFTQLIQAIQDDVRDDSFLVNTFNVEYSSNAILTHFRLLTSAWMKLNPQRYQAFIAMPLNQYCATRVETVKSEIDEVGLQALIDGVIERSGFAVEILYLDRSQGDAVTPHLLTPSQANIATIRLLYRPGHYDLLYRPEPTVNMEPVVNYQYAMASNYSPWDQGALSFDVNASLMSIPNLMMDPSFGMAAPMSPDPMPPAAPPAAPAPAQAPAPPSPYRVSSPQEVYHPVPASPPPPPVSVSPPAPQMSGPPPPMSSLPKRSSEGPQIRLNPLVMKPNLSHSLPISTPFKNSPYNQAHFQNQDFEPIHWEPSDSRK